MGYVLKLSNMFQIRDIPRVFVNIENAQTMAIEWAKSYGSVDEGYQFVESRCLCHLQMKHFEVMSEIQYSSSGEAEVIYYTEDWIAAKQFWMRAAEHAIDAI